MSRARDNANLSPTIADARMPNLTGAITTVEGAVATTIADDAITGGKLANDIAINTSGAITTTGAFRSIGIDDNSNALAMTIDASENVGIGRASSITKQLHIDNDSADVGIVLESSADSAIFFTKGSSSHTWAVGCDTSASNGFSIAYLASAYPSLTTQNLFSITPAGNVGIGTSAPANNLDVIGLTGIKIADSAHSSSHWARIYHDSAGSADLIFAMAGGGTEETKMRITSSGNVGIGAVPSAGQRLLILGPTNDDQSYNLFCENSDGTNLMWVRNDGVLWAYQAWSTSDRRKKKNISYVTEDILPKIENLKLAKFDYVDLELKNSFGFIAQDVETVFPDCVKNITMPEKLYVSSDEIPEGKEIGDVKVEKEEQKNLNYTYMFSHLVKAVQELSAKVTTLENA